MAFPLSVPLPLRRDIQNDEEPVREMGKFYGGRELSAKDPGEIY